MTAEHSLGFDCERIRRTTFAERVEFHGEIASTNDEALRLSAQDVDAPVTLVLADRQTAGRGRGANRWWSAPGGLTFSLLLRADRLELPEAQWPQISLATAVAICTEIEERATAAACGVKWPNDVHFEGRKIAGILVEIAPAHANRRSIVVGVGINVNNSWRDAPEELRRIGTSLVDLTGQSHDPTDLLVNLLNGVQMRLGQLRDHDSRLADAWQSLCVLRGRHVEVDTGAHILGGTCRGIDHDGALVIEGETTPHRLFGGVVKKWS
jgi:BirA family biotin operon repressor/biotin-[acetyl-CoA-carboxylase] ligase